MSRMNSNRTSRPEQPHQVGRRTVAELSQELRSQPGIFTKEPFKNLHHTLDRRQRRRHSCRRLVTHLLTCRGWFRIARSRNRFWRIAEPCGRFAAVCYRRGLSRNSATRFRENPRTNRLRCCRSARLIGLPLLRSWRFFLGDARLTTELSNCSTADLVNLFGEPSRVTPLVAMPDRASSDGQRAP
jgi:hypothetical protein